MVFKIKLTNRSIGFIGVQIHLVPQVHRHASPTLRSAQVAAVALQCFIGHDLVTGHRLWHHSAETHHYKRIHFQGRCLRGVQYERKRLGVEHRAAALSPGQLHPHLRRARPLAQFHLLADYTQVYAHSAAKTGPAAVTGGTECNVCFFQQQAGL